MYTVILNISTTIPACSFSPWSHGNCVGCNAVFVCVSACVCAYRGPTNVAHITCRTIMVNLHFHEPYLLLQLCLWSHPSTMVHVKQRTAAPRCTMLWMYAPFLGPQSRSPGQNLRKTPVPQEPGWPTGIGTWRACQPHAVGQLLFLSSGSCQVGDISVCLFCKCICFRWWKQLGDILWQNKHKSGCSWTCCVELYSNGLIHQHSLLNTVTAWPKLRCPCSRLTLYGCKQEAEMLQNINRPFFSITWGYLSSTNTNMAN